MKKLFITGVASLLLSFSGHNINEASYYSDYYHGRQAADGSIFRQDRMTAASNKHPLGSQIRVTNIENGKSVDVKVTDRLNKRYSQRVDLSKKAFKEIGNLKKGILKLKENSRDIKTIKTLY